MERTRHYMIAQTLIQAPPLEPGLYLVATPIGNLRDITLRALEVLAGCDILACEDTRVTRKLLDRYGIKQKLFSYHEHNATQSGPVLLEALRNGKTVALVSDAGTPLISDPGFRLVGQAQQDDIKIIPIPGASAVTTALIASGLPTDSFFFAGFLPTRQGQRQTRLQELASMDSCLIFFESPHRVQKTLADMIEIYGADRPAAVARELTKTFETIKHGTLAQLNDYFAERTLKGEIVMLVGPPLSHEEEPDQDEIDTLLVQTAQHMSGAKAAAQIAKMTGQRKNDLYQRLLELTNKR